MRFLNDTSPFSTSRKISPVLSSVALWGLGFVICWAGLVLFYQYYQASAVPIAVEEDIAWEESRIEGYIQVDSLNLLLDQLAGLPQGKQVFGREIQAAHLQVEVLDSARYDTRFRQLFGNGRPSVPLRLRFPIEDNYVKIPYETLFSLIQSTEQAHKQK